MTTDRLLGKANVALFHLHEKLNICNYHGDYEEANYILKQFKPIAEAYIYDKR